MDPGSSPSPRQLWKYDVFVSFRGDDTRKSFTSHLQAALKRKGIHTFLDDAEKGMEIAYMLKEMEISRILIPVLSRKYADSRWCLDELKETMELHGSQERTVLPVFYHVDPAEAIDPTKLYKEALDKYPDADKHNVELWSDALKKVPIDRGLVVRDEPESQVVEQIVNDVINKLDKKLSIFPVGLVGMKDRAERLERLLDLKKDDVRVIIGIHGIIGGIGKTTLARVVYSNISRNFDAACFLSNVGEVSKRHNGLSHLQEKLIRRVLELDDLKIKGDQEGSMLLRTRLRSLKILLVVDDVDHPEQLEKLAGNVDWFGNGSRIIVTTRDEHILKRYTLEDVKFYKVQVKPLNPVEAHELFCRKAFKSDEVREGYEKLTDEVLEYAGGHPFVIESLSSSFDWSGEMEKPQKIPDQWIMRVLRKGFNGLSHLEKEVFLDIACFFVGEEIGDVKEILKDCRRVSEVEINDLTYNLTQKSLMTISDHQKICMPEMYKKMGQEIVCQESLKAPGKRSRLWLPNDLHHVNEINIANVEAIVLKQEDFRGLPLKAKVFSKMIRLRLLIIENVRFSGSLSYLPNSLIYVSWHKYPLTYLPSSFEPKRLVKLVLLESNITQLWEGIKRLPDLRMLSLRNSKGLTKMPDFQGLLNLEELDLEGCAALLDIDPSIESLATLRFLNLKDCSSLTSISNKLLTRKSLKINVAGCTALNVQMEPEFVSY